MYTRNAARAMSLMLLEKLAPCLVEHTYMERSYASLVGENKIKKKKGCG